MKGQHLKRCLALLLSLALIISMMPMQVLAETAPAAENDAAAANVKTYTITFYADADKTTVLEEVTVEEGQIPEWTVPTKDSDDYYRYEFVSWDEEVTAAYADGYYYAIWKEVEQFRATFVDWDYEFIKEIRVDKGANLKESTELPEEPQRASDGEYSYEFTGWSPELTTEMTGDATYVAQYEATEIITYVDLTFTPVKNGTFTVNGTEITEETEFKQTTTKTEYQLKAIPDEGYEFFGWYDGAKYLHADAEWTFKATEDDMNIEPYFVPVGTARFSVDGNMYAGLGRAITAAKKMQSDGVMILMNDVTLEAGNYEIPEGLTLLIPCDEDAAVYRETPIALDETWQSPVAYRTLTLADGANLIVNGEISVTAPHVPGAGGRANGSSPHKSYGQIITEEGSSITVNDGGALYAYGYITGDGSVTAKSGATVYEYFQIMDFRGGSATTDMATTGKAFGVFPLSQYYVQNIEVPLTIEAGASEFCYASLKMSGNVVSAAIGFIGTGQDMMFKLNSGSVTKYYDGETDRLIAEIDGDLEISPIEISGGGNTIDSADFILPINNNITIKANSGNIKMTQDVALTPGTELIVGADATCVLEDDCNVYVYDQETWGNYCCSTRKPFVGLNYAPGKNYTRTSADLKDALVQIDGTLDASDGYIYTTKGGANICSTDNGKIVLRKGVDTITYQFEYTGPPAAGEQYYGIYHEIEITPAILQNANGTSVTQDIYEDRGIINYVYKDGAWSVEGHIIVIDEGYLPSCNTHGLTDSQHCNFENCPEHTILAEEIPPLGHKWKTIAAKQPTYTSVGWLEHEECEVCGIKEDGYKENKEIPKLEGAVIATYEDFLTNLETLENWAADYVKANPGKDPVDLVIKYIRTGVERYNSGSWGIMAGYEDTAFAEFVASKEDKYNSEASAAGKPLVKVSGMKNLINFELPNGNEADFGHMFGTMDITYNNAFGVNHADVGGWAGDIVDLLCLADQFGTGDAKTINEMVQYIKDTYLFKETEEVKAEFGETPREGSFSIVDMYGDLDAYYLMKALEDIDYETGALTELLKGYFTADLTDEQRATYILENRFEDKSLRVDLREEVYAEVTGNKVVNTLEATREFDNKDLTKLRQASCYAFADYICELAGDYVEQLDNPYMSVFASTFSTLAPGITQKTYQATTADGKQMDYYIATADVTRDDVHVYTNYYNNDLEGAMAGNWGMQRVLDQANAAQENYSNPESDRYIENFNVITAINGGGYDMSNGKPSGLFVMEGNEIMAPNNHEFFGILDDGTALIASRTEYEKLKAQGKVKQAIGAFGTLLVKDGKVNITATSDYYTNRASRTAIGITKTGKVVFMVMDGRQGEYSCGGSMEEIAQVMLDAGCVSAMNLDGGGSTTYVARQEGEDKLSVVNNPSDGVPRSVSTSLFMASTAPNSTEFDHAVVESNYNYLTVNSSVQLTASGVSATNNAVELPEGTTWVVANDAYGEVNDEGVFTAKAEGDVEVKLMLDDAEVGSITLHIVTPDNLYFSRPSVNAVYGQTVEIPVIAVYNNKEVAINGDDIDFTLSNDAAGKIDGLNFVIAEGSNLKNVQITATLPNNAAATGKFTVYLYNQGEASFDFDQATGGNRQFAWDRKISNTVTDDNNLYSIVDAKQGMTTSYTFAIDMSQIDMPERLAGLTYMLPGADMEGASAWTFLCQLAERMSDQTEVSAVVEFDADVKVDYSGLTLVNDYFALTDKSFDEATNTLTMILKWKKQDKPIEVAMANPVCILSGIKTEPKAGASWNNREQLDVVNKGKISYTVYMRASGLYTFSQNEQNQEIYGLKPYVHPLIETERGGYFSSVYAEFEESYKLDKAVKNGWVTGEGGMRYYDNGKMYTGVREVEGVYYDFGQNGINRGQTPFTGEATIDGKEYYITNGKLLTGWIRFGENEWRYYNEKTGIREAVTVESTPKSCIVDTRYTFTSESGSVKVTKHEDAGGHEYANETTKDAVCTVCGWHRVDMEDVILTLGFTKATYNGNAKIPSHKAVNPNTNEELVKTGDYRDYYWTFANNTEVGKASVTLTARKPAFFVNQQQWRGNYRGEVTATFTILPDAPTNVAAKVYADSATLTWDASKVAETDTDDNKTVYVIYKKINKGEWKQIGTTTDTTYTAKGLKASSTYSFRVAAQKVGTDGETYTSAKYGVAKLTYAYAKTKASNVEKTGKIKLTWNKVGTIKTYQVYRATKQNGKYTLVKKVTGTSYVDTTAKAGTKYYYKVKANGKFGNIVSRTCDLSRPVVTASNVAKTGKIKLSWKKVTGATKYNVYRATKKNGTYKFIASTTKTSMINSKVTAGKTYYYKVKAVKKGNADANSAYSLVDKRTCKLASPVIKLKSTTKGQIKVSWKKVSGASKYKIYRKVSGGKYKFVTTTSKLTYTNKKLKSGKKYYYKVVAVKKGNSSANSAYSAVKSIKAK